MTGTKKMCKFRRKMGWSPLNSAIQVPQKCYEFKPTTELLKTRVNAMSTLWYVISYEIVVWTFVWTFCCQKNWITLASNLESTKKIMAKLHTQPMSAYISHFCFSIFSFPAKLFPVLCQYFQTFTASSFILLTAFLSSQSKTAWQEKRRYRFIIIIIIY